MKIIVAAVVMSAVACVTHAAQTIRFTVDGEEIVSRKLGKAFGAGKNRVYSNATNSLNNDQLQLWAMSQRVQQLKNKSRTDDEQQEYQEILEDIVSLQNVVDVKKDSKEITKECLKEAESEWEDIGCFGIKRRKPTAGERLVNGVLTVVVLGGVIYYFKDDILNMINPPDRHI